MLFCDVAVATTCWFQMTFSNEERGAVQRCHVSLLNTNANPLATHYSDAEHPAG